MSSPTSPAASVKAFDAVLQRTWRSPGPGTYLPQPQGLLSTMPPARSPRIPREDRVKHLARGSVGSDSPGPGYYGGRIVGPSGGRERPKSASIGRAARVTSAWMHVTSREYMY